MPPSSGKKGFQRLPAGLFNNKRLREIERKGAGVGLKLLRANVRHLGTEQNLQILQSIYKELETKITMKFRTEVADILTEKNEEGLAITGVESKSGEW
jgi:uncharacterized protein